MHEVDEVVVAEEEAPADQEATTDKTSGEKPS